MANSENTLAFSQNRLKRTIQLSCHVTPWTRWHIMLALLWLCSWYIIFSNLIGWRQTIQFFLNLDTCILATLEVSYETIQLIINWTIQRIVAWSVLHSYLTICIIKWVAWWQQCFWGVFKHFRNCTIWCQFLQIFTGVQ